MLLKEARSRRRACTGRRRPTWPSCPSEATLPRGRDGHATAEKGRPFRRPESTVVRGHRGSSGWLSGSCRAGKSPDVAVLALPAGLESAPPAPEAGSGLFKPSFWFVCLVLNWSFGPANLQSLCRNAHSIAIYEQTGWPRSAFDAGFVQTWSVGTILRSPIVV
jgi:hypothetical protein